MSENYNLKESAEVIELSKQTLSDYIRRHPLSNADLELWKFYMLSDILKKLAIIADSLKVDGKGSES